MARALHSVCDVASSDLELVALSKSFGDAIAVDRIDLKIAAGTYCCLLGPSGCGKTSTLRMIAGHESAQRRRRHARRREHHRTCRRPRAAPR